MMDKNYQMVIFILLSYLYLCSRFLRFLKIEGMKDSIDFGSMEISTLFRKLLIPTVLGIKQR